MAKDISFDIDARKKMENGAPLITNDGVTIAK